jgi:hypothetical protein
MKMIKRYAIYNDGVQCDWVEAEKGHGGWWCKTDDVEELEKAIDALIEERDLYHEENEKLKKEFIERYKDLLDEAMFLFANHMEEDEYFKKDIAYLEGLK